MADGPLHDPASESLLVTNQPLRVLFDELVSRNFEECLHLSDHEIIEYVGNLLTEFSRIEKLYSIRNAHGKALEDVGEMLLESNPLFEASSFDREREVRKHIGDFTLFFAGLFPEAVHRWRLRRQRLDSIVDYVRAGKESYFIVSEFNLFEYKSSAPFFKKMADQFESCVFGLNLVKRNLEQMQQESYVRARKYLV
jgi:hypothetical protein